MLTQPLSRHGETETRRHGAGCRGPRVPASPRPRVFCVAFSLAIALLTACGSKSIHPRTVIPADAIVYLESNDLGRTLAAITENAKFQQLAKTKPNLSMLNGVKVSIAVTGFAASEEQVTEE